MKRFDILAGVVCTLIGGALVALLFIVISLHEPAQTDHTCDNGQSTQVEDGVVYKTYIPANDTCNK